MDLVEVERDIKKRRRFLRGGLFGGNYRGTLYLETGLTLFFTIVPFLGFGGELDWRVLLWQIGILLFMFDKAHTKFEAMLRCDGL